MRKSTKTLYLSLLLAFGCLHEQPAQADVSTVIYSTAALLKIAYNYIDEDKSLPRTLIKCLTDAGLFWGCLEAAENKHESVEAISTAILIIGGDITSKYVANKISDALGLKEKKRGWW